MNARLTTLILFIFLVTLVSPAFASPLTANSITSATPTYTQYYIGDKIIIIFTYEHEWATPTNHKVIATFDGELQEKFFHLDNLTDTYSSSFVFDTINKNPALYNVELNGYIDLRNDIDNMVKDSTKIIPITLIKETIEYSLSNLIVKSNIQDVQITYPLGSGTTGVSKSLTIPDLLEGVEYTISASKPNYVSQSKKIILGSNDATTTFNMLEQSTDITNRIVKVTVSDSNNNRIEGAEININGKILHSMKDDFAYFTVPMSEITMTIEKSGYYNYINQYTVDSNLQLDITLIDYIPPLSNPNSDFAQSSNIKYVYVDLNKKDQITSDLILDNPTKTIKTLASSAVNWSIILGAYLGAAFLLFIFNNMNKSTILLFGTISWVLPLIIMFIGFNPFILNYISGSDSIYYGIINFVIYGIIFTALSKKR